MDSSSREARGFEAQARILAEMKNTVEIIFARFAEPVEYRRNPREARFCVRSSLALGANQSANELARSLRCPSASEPKTPVAFP